MKNLPKIKIKKATISDIKPFYAFFAKSIKNQFPEYSITAKNYFLKKQYTKTNIKKWLKGKTGDILLALNKKEIIGYLLANPPYGGAAFISWIAVDKKFQGQGIGSQLLKKYEIIAKKQKAHKVYLWADKRNIKFYKRIGYTLGGYVPKFCFKADDYLFYKDI